MLDLERFIEDCRGAAASPGGPRAVRELVARAVAEPSALAAALGDPEHAGVADADRRVRAVSGAGG
jgi:hypothetical protein